MFTRAGQVVKVGDVDMDGRARARLREASRETATRLERVGISEGLPSPVSLTFIRLSFSLTSILHPLPLSFRVSVASNVFSGARITLLSPLLL